MDKQAREDFDRLNPIHPDVTPEVAQKAARVRQALTRHPDPELASFERHESWLYDAARRYVEADSALRSDFPAYGSKEERINRVLCRMLERMWHELLWSNGGHAAQVKVLGELKEYVKK